MADYKADIVIIGAGIGGCIAALALAPFYSVLLIDKDAQPKGGVGECLAPAAGRILHKLGLMNLLEHGHLMSHGLLSYWGTDQPAVVDPVVNPDGCGWHLDRQLFERQLREVVQRRAVPCLWPASFVDSKREPDGWLIRVQHNAELVQVQSQRVIDATGRPGSFARELGVSRHNSDQQLSIWLTAAVSVRKQISVLSSTSSGWWYSAPLPALPDLCPLGSGHQARVFALQLHPHQFDKRLSQSSAVFLQAAASASGLGTLVRQIIPGTEKLHGVVTANSSKLVQGCGEDWFAIGDAALSFDPLSSQGIFNAMATAMQLADLVIEHGLDHKDIPALYQAQLDNIWRHYMAHKEHYYALVG